MPQSYSQPAGWWKRSFSLLLLLSYLLPLAQAAYAASRDPEAGLPVCCRTHGKHACSMGLAHPGGLGDGQHSISATVQISEKCPCFLTSSAATQSTHASPASVRGSEVSARYQNLHPIPWPSPQVQQAAGAHRKRGPPIALFFA